MNEILSSRQNPLIQRLRALQNGKIRRESGCFLLEGANAVGAALEKNWPLREVLATPEERDLSARAQNRGFKVTRVTPSTLSYACDSCNLQIAAIGETPPPSNAKIEDLSGLLLVIDGVSDPGNVGTLLRAADAAGVQKVVLTTGCADIWSPKVVRSAAGSLFALDFWNLSDATPQNIEKLLRVAQIPLVCAQAHGENSPFGSNWPRRAALVLGHETRGVSPVFAENSRSVTIPIFGGAESLNVAMAGTLLMYAWRISSLEA